MRSALIEIKGVRGYLPAPERHCATKRPLLNVRLHGYEDV